MYHKVRFRDPHHGVTPGIVLHANIVDQGIGEISRRFPYHEAPKMSRLDISPGYPSEAEAFNHDFDRPGRGQHLQREEESPCP